MMMVMEMMMLSQEEFHTKRRCERSGAVILCAAKAGESLVLADQRGSVGVGSRRWSVVSEWEFCCLSLSLLVKKSRAKKGSHPDLICISLSAFRFPYTYLATVPEESFFEICQ
eukprot:scaffold14622_cov86-Skeletonema_marinoi.AAC.1